MLYATITVLALVAVTKGSVVPDGTNNREDKGLAGLNKLLPSLLSLLNITIANDPCDTESGNPAQGICYSQKECANMPSGEADGTCANGYGVCCVDVTGAGGYADVTITKSGSYFQCTSCKSPGVITATIDPPKGTSQIFLEFEDLHILGPSEGDCSNDTFIVVGGNPGTEFPVLCGDNSGQHMYIDVDNSDGPYKLLATMSDVEFDRSFKVKTTFYSEKQAPARCLQYHTEKSGDFSSFNYGDDGHDPIALNNQNYAICFGYVSGFCDIGVTFSRFDLGALDGTCGGDLVHVGREQICGDFIDYTARANATGPISFNVMTDDTNEGLQEGFSGSYMMMAC